MILYRSTRGDAPALDFAEVVLAGLAVDGGLYVPERIPAFTPSDIAAMQSLSYQELAARILGVFTEGTMTDAELRAIIDDAYGSFRHPAIAPLTQVGHQQWMLELHHGPTLAFKDFALQVLGRLLEHFLAKRNQKITIVGATSGDTGSAAIEGCRGRAGMDIFILYPHGRVSDVQRRQMTTVDDANVHTLAIDGSFDDCQNLVKEMFGDTSFRNDMGLAAVNSINWARILVQVVYYFHAACALGAPAREVAFCVPTGNFGDIYAGYVARQMGLPIGKLIIATNQNDILDRCIKNGDYTMQGVAPSLSPSMDIQISSNFERLLFDLYEGDGARIKNLMAVFRQSGTITLDEAPYNTLRCLFSSHKTDDAETLATIKRVYEETGEIVDPHTAVGLNAAAHADVGDLPLITLATAHAAKFPDAVKQAIGRCPDLPPHLGDLMTRTERATPLPADLSVIQNHIRAHVTA